MQVTPMIYVYDLKGELNQALRVKTQQGLSEQESAIYMAKELLEFDTNLSKALIVSEQGTLKVSLEY